MDVNIEMIYISIYMGEARKKPYAVGPKEYKWL